MEVKVKWVEGMRFIGLSGKGHGLVIDGASREDGSAGSSPMELLLLGLGGCSGIDVVHILKKARQPIDDCEVEVIAERADAIPAVFTKIHMIFTVTGAGMSKAKVDNAVTLSAEKYCSATTVLSKAVDITHEVKFIDTAA